MGQIGDLSVDEAEVRRLCGNGAFARGDRLETAGHVLAPTLYADALRADVLGTWRRVDRVVVRQQSGKLTSECSCGSDAFCLHAAALLLHWLRARSSFSPAVAAEPAAGNRPEPDTPVQTDETPEQEYARLLEGETLPRLRKIAQLWGFRIQGRGKAEIIPRLAAITTAPENVDRILASLSHDALSKLAAAHLLDGQEPDAESEADDRTRPDSLPDPLMALLDLGLLLAEYRPGRGQRLVVPRAVVARMPYLLGMAGAVDPGDSRVLGEQGPHRPGPRLNVGELIAVIATQIGQGALKRRAPEASASSLAYYVPRGWVIDPDELRGVQAAELLYHRRRVRLLPPPPVVEDADLESIADRLGQAPPAVSFAARIMLDLGILEGDAYLQVDQSRLHELLDMDPSPRLASLSRAWLQSSGSVELQMILGKRGLLTLTYYPAGYGGTSILLDEAETARRFIARVVGWMRPGIWYDFESFLDGLSRLKPSLLSDAVSAYGRGAYWIGKPGSGRDEGSRDAAALAVLRRAFVFAELGGPLSWLGMVDVRTGNGTSSVFLVRPEARLLAERSVDEDAEARPTRLVVKPDLTVLVPAGTSEVRVHSFLGEAGILEAATPDGLCYRLTPEGAGHLFDTGVTREEMLAFLSDRCDGELPREVVHTVDGWWISFGSVRLYDDLTLIELSDDYLLPELLATTSIRSTLIHTFSSRIIAVESREVERVVAELTRLGHAPKVVEE